MVNAFEVIADIVGVIGARPNKAKNSYYKVLGDRNGINGKIPLVRISNHKTHCVTWLGDVNDLGTAMRFPANYYFSIVIENEPSLKDENVPVRVKPFTVHEYTFKQEELEESDIHAIIQDVKGIFTTGEFANSTGKGKYDPVKAKVVQQTPPSTNNESNTKNMKKNTIKLNEKQLRNIVAESVKKVLKEGIGDFTDYNGVEFRKKLDSALSALEECVFYSKKIDSQTNEFFNHLYDELYGFMVSHQFMPDIAYSTDYDPDKRYDGDF